MWDSCATALDSGKMDIPLALTPSVNGVYCKSERDHY